MGTPGFRLYFDDIVAGGDGLLLAQDLIVGTAPTQHEIDSWMRERGWESLRESRGVSIAPRDHAWRRGDIGAFDANVTNFVRSEVDGLLYPIDLIVWHMTE